jgi:excisionase family DNA binding protein
VSEVQFYTVRTVATILAVSEATVYRLIEQGTLPAIRLGGDPANSIRIAAEDFHRILREVWSTYPGDDTEIRGRRR